MVDVIGNKNTQELEEKREEKGKGKKTNMKKKKKRKREISRVENRECFGEITRIFKKRKKAIDKEIETRATTFVSS